MTTRSSEENTGWDFSPSFSCMLFQKTLIPGTLAFRHSSCHGNLKVYPQALYKSAPSFWQRCFYGNILLEATRTYMGCARRLLLHIIPLKYVKPILIGLAMLKQETVRRNVSLADWTL